MKKLRDKIRKMLGLAEIVATACPVTKQIFSMKKGLLASVPNCHWLQLRENSLTNECCFHKDNQPCFFKNKVI